MLYFWNFGRRDKPSTSLPLRKCCGIEISKALFVEWWSLVTHPQHVISEWHAIIEAWAGSIELQQKSGNAKLAADTMPADEGLSFHRRLLNQELG